MSIRLMSQVYDRKISHPEQSVLLAMADHAKDDGTKCFPSVPLLAWKTGYSERQIQRIMAGLRTKKALVVTVKATQHRSAEYQINLLALPEKAPFRGDILSSDQNPSDLPGVTSDALRGDVVVSSRGDAVVSPEPSLTAKEPLTATDTDAKASAQAANGAAPRAPLAMHTNGSTQPEPPASPGLPSVAVNGASPAGEPDASPAKPSRSARNGKANGKANAEPDSARAAESKLVFGELCAWLGLDWTRLPANTRGRLNKTAAALLDAGLGAAAVARARDAWRFDWRAKGGQLPDLSQVEGLVARAGAGLAAAETPGHYPRYGVHDAPARVKMSEVF